MIMISSCVQSNAKYYPTKDPESYDQCLSYKCTASDGTDFYVFVNARADSKIVFDVSHDLTNAECVVDAYEAGTTAIAEPRGYSITHVDSGAFITVDPVTSIILRN
jgi:hypothetical protein